MRVEAGAQCELKGLAGDGPRRALDIEVATGEALVKVTLLQVQPEKKHAPKGHLATTHCKLINYPIGHQKKQSCCSPGKVNSQERIMDVIGLQMLSNDGLHLYKAIFCGLLLSQSVCG